MIVYFARERSKFKPLNHGLQSAASGGNCRSGHQCCLVVFIIIIIITIISLFSVIGVKTRKVSQGGPRDAAVNLDRPKCRILRRHRTCGLPATARLSCWSLSADCRHAALSVKSVKYYRKNQSADKHITWSFSITIVIISFIIIYRQRNIW